MKMICILFTQKMHICKKQIEAFLNNSYIDDKKKEDCHELMEIAPYKGNHKK